LNATHQLLVYADDVHTMCENLNIVRGNTEALLEGCREVLQEVNTDKAKYMLISPPELLRLVIDALKKWQSSSIWEGQ
jgi:flagellar biosynthesis/type III secretory pathway protein FliH